MCLQKDKILRFFEAGFSLFIIITSKTTCIIIHSILYRILLLLMSLFLYNKHNENNFLFNSSSSLRRFGRANQVGVLGAPQIVFQHISELVDIPIHAATSGDFGRLEQNDSGAVAEFSVGKLFV